jgi:hypothetical protein
MSRAGSIRFRQVVRETSKSLDVFFLVSIKLPFKRKLTIINRSVHCVNILINQVHKRGKCGYMGDCLHYFSKLDHHRSLNHHHGNDISSRQIH